MRKSSPAPTKTRALRKAANEHPGSRVPEIGRQSNGWTISSISKISLLLLVDGNTIRDTGHYLIILLILLIYRLFGSQVVERGGNKINTFVSWFYVFEFWVLTC